MTKREDFVRFGIDLNPEARPLGLTAWAGRRAVGMGGIVIDADGRVWGHVGATEDYFEATRRGLHRRALKTLRRLKGIGPIFATCETEIPRAAEWLARLGFIETDERIGDRIVYMRPACF